MLDPSLHPAFAIAVFGLFILVVAFDRLDMVVAGLLGALAMGLAGVVGPREMSVALALAEDPLSLLFGGMVVARVLVPTGLFDLLGALLLRATAGSGRRLLLGIILVVAPLCAVLPNATVVLLLAPVVISVARRLGIAIAPPLVLTVVVSNSAGLLTLVGDPATFIVGSAINMEFGAYLRRVSPGGLLAILVIVPVLPLLFRDIWRAPTVALPPMVLPRVERPAYAMAALLVLCLMVVLFLAGDMLPRTMGPPTIAILAAACALLALHGYRVEPVRAALADIDWSTLLFLFCVFVMVQGLVHTGVLHGFSGTLARAFGTSFLAVALVLLAAIGVASGLLANTPVVLAMVVVVKGYFVDLEVVPEDAMGHVFAAWPAGTLPVFVAMMFGATLGGNATVIGAAANIVAAGIAMREGERLSFGRFLRIGGPIMAAQLAFAGCYVIGLWALLH